MSQSEWDFGEGHSEFSFQGSITRRKGSWSCLGSHSIFLSELCNSALDVLLSSGAAVLFTLDALIFANVDIE